jgi:aminodeoxyfutalosine deaminase
LPRLLEEGLIVTLNADDPSMFATSITDEFGFARDVVGLSDEELADISRTAVRVSFAPQELKDAFCGDVDAWLTG